MLEVVLTGLFLGTWGLSLFYTWGRVYPGTLDLSLYQLYGLASALGWLAGNVFVWRRRLVPDSGLRRRLALIYFLGPPSLVSLARALAPYPSVADAPLAGLYAIGVYAVFFTVPVVLKPTGR